MKLIKKHFCSKKMLYKMKAILSDHRLVGFSEIKNDDCDVLMIKGNKENGLTPGDIPR